MPERVQSHSFITRIADKVFRNNGLHAMTPAIDADVSEMRHADRLVEQMRLCLHPPGGEIQARSEAVALGRMYQGLSKQGREKFFYHLATEFDRDPEKVARLAAVRASAKPGDDLAAMDAKLESAFATPRSQILKQFLSVPEGNKFLIDMRADLLQLLAEDGAKTRHDETLVKAFASVKGLERDLKSILSTEFDISRLSLKRITLDTSPDILEKVCKYEQVHKLESVDDVIKLLKRDDRRIYAFFHPNMPDEPFIILNVKFTRGLESSIQKIRSELTPVVETQDANTAMFDSISNPFAATPQSGLSGIGRANFLIKRTAEEIAGELPNIKTFSTLSPIPGFRKWLEPKLKSGDESLLLKDEAREIAKLAPQGSGNAARDLLEALNGDWKEQRATQKKLAPIMERLCARYLLLEEKGSDHAALDLVARLHLSNGAQVERINWMGDMSPEGMKRAFGMTANYLYNLRHVDENHERYTQGIIMASPQVRELAGKTNGQMRRGA